MDSKLFKAFRRRDVYVAGGNPHIFRGRGPQGNTALHLAARLSNKHVVKTILRLEPSFLYERNRNGETPMHIAAKAGNASVIEVFVDCYNNRVVREGGQENILWMRDNNGNTYLHKAVQNHRDLVAQSALSIAIDTSSTYIAWVLIKEHPSSLDNKGLNDLTLLHCAVIRQNYVFVAEIVKRKMEVINTQDEYERNPLHYAAVLGNVAIARRLLQADGSSSLGHKGDCNGQTPLHLAAQNDHPTILSMLVNGYPNAIEVLNRRQRSILHFAALNGSVSTVKFILTLPEMEDLINSADGDGNTPLHLAAMNFHENVVDILSKNERVNIRATNHNQFTALAIVQSSTQYFFSLKDIMKLRCGGNLYRYLTVKILKEAITLRAFYPKDILEDGRCRAMEKEVRQIRHKENSEMCQTLLVMATLIASFTFTAAFTIPGDYKNDSPDEGMATLVRKSGLQAFVITVTVAMISSMTAAVLALGQIRYGNHERYTNVNLIPLATTLIWLGLLSMSLAFVTGLFLVLSNNMPLAIVVVCIGCAFPFLLYVFGPFFGVQTFEITRALLHGGSPISSVFAVL
ncbi:hypothetical protein ACOSP7_030531 [Xanthoceras sorbifolium]